MNSITLFDVVGISVLVIILLIDFGNLTSTVVTVESGFGSGSVSVPESVSESVPNDKTENLLFKLSDLNGLTAHLLELSFDILNIIDIFIYFSNILI